MILTLGRYKFKASLSYITRPYIAQEVGVERRDTDVRGKERGERGGVLIELR